ncbi:hypothetical protein MACH08_19300 [Oceanobacillus kimchii]|uniref:Uncharacterized protein n=1 Tax=Oceanobacillus kimchii TaxID=746691 RepID=A0ABQ5TK87_9BACI|nr:hypothetical protein MACH08_19300 [Oceanobacillus kimchii]
MNSLIRLAHEFQLYPILLKKIHFTNYPNTNNLDSLKMNLSIFIKPQTNGLTCPEQLFL